MTHFTGAIVAILAIATFFFMCADGTPAVGIKGVITCSDQIIDSVSGDAAYSIYRAMTEAVVETPSKGYDYLCKDKAGDVTYWVHGACNGVISQSDCKECMEIARDCLYQECPYNTGGHVDLEDCRMRFENYPIDKNY